MPEIKETLALELVEDKESDGQILSDKLNTVQATHLVKIKNLNSLCLTTHEDYKSLAM